jgi:hypothetical protein
LPQNARTIQSESSALVDPNAKRPTAARRWGVVFAARCVPRSC